MRPHYPSSSDKLLFYNFYHVISRIIDRWNAVQAELWRVGSFTTVLSQSEGSIPEWSCRRIFLFSFRNWSILMKSTAMNKRELVRIEKHHPRDHSDVFSAVRHYKGNVSEANFNALKSCKMEKNDPLTEKSLSLKHVKYMICRWHFQIVRFLLRNPPNVNANFRLAFAYFFHSNVSIKLNCKPRVSKR